MIFVLLIVFGIILEIVSITIFRSNSLQTFSSVTKLLVAFILACSGIFIAELYISYLNVFNLLVLFMAALTFLQVGRNYGRVS